MKDKLRKFFKILEIEFQDLEDALETYRDALESRYEKKEITEYVYKENNALLNREIGDIRIIKENVAELSGEEYADLDEAAARVVEIIENFKDFPPVVHRYMERKVEKVLEYVRILDKQH